MRRKCKECGNSTDEGMSTSAHIVTVDKDLQTLVDNYFKREEEYFCKECKKDSQHSLSMIFNGKPLFCLSLNRALTGNMKNFSKVTIEETIKIENDYHLYAVIVHIGTLTFLSYYKGSSPNYGHYVAFIKVFL